MSDANKKPADTMALQQRCLMALMWRWLTQITRQSLCAITATPHVYADADWWQIPKAYRAKIVLEIESITLNNDTWKACKSAWEL